MKGVALRLPHTKGIKSSRHGNMRELRVRTRPPIRIFYAFDPRLTAILLIGGHKTHPERFFREYIPRADAIYDEYLREIRLEQVQDCGRRREDDHDDGTPFVGEADGGALHAGGARPYPG